MKSAGNICTSRALIICTSRALIIALAMLALGILHAGPAYATKYGCWYFAPGNLIPGTGHPPQDETQKEISAKDWGEEGGLNPIRDARGIAKSQVHNPGGYYSPGDECAASNFSGADRDSYCEARGSERFMVGCSSNNVHVGIDINGGSRNDCLLMRNAQERILRHKTDPTIADLVAVQAVQDGTITYIGDWTVDLTTNGRTYRHTHLNMKTLRFGEGDTVKKGDIIGFIYDDFCLDPGCWTTFHLHWEIKYPFLGFEIYLPPYMAYIRSKERALGAMCQPVQ